MKDLLCKARFANEDINFALLAYRLTPPRDNVRFSCPVAHGSSSSNNLAVYARTSDTCVIHQKNFEEHDQQKKDRQIAYYIKRNGVRPLPKLHERDRVLVWDLVHRDWRLPTVVLKMVNNQSYLVQLDGGAMVRRNCHELEVRTSPDLDMEDKELWYPEDTGESQGRKEQEIDRGQQEVVGEGIPGNHLPK